jgi:DNA repair ATPase RecN
MPETPPTDPVLDGLLRTLEGAVTDSYFAETRREVNECDVRIANARTAIHSHVSTLRAENAALRSTLTRLTEAREAERRFGQCPLFNVTAQK